jgi:hypothetical protein
MIINFPVFICLRIRLYSVYPNGFAEPSSARLVPRLVVPEEYLCDARLNRYRFMTTSTLCLIVRNRTLNISRHTIFS